MKKLIVLGVMVFVGVGVWQVGNRLSTDAVGMGVGLIFGVMAGVPAALLVLSATGGRRNDDGSAYDDGYRAGMRDTTALALGTRPQLEQYDGRTIDGSLATRYSNAHPFGPPVNVRRTTTYGNGLVLEENHLLPADVAERLTRGAR